ncbi:MAG TPA: M20/M25/M40 family metallo-hydrolase [Chitinophagaceae bacterium]|nr:M20/M25/M40 family metallo-hydrolase [Chitinophagaceae bacterium]
MMKKIIVIPAMLFCGFLQAQKINTIINAAAVEKIESVLSSDSLRGRKVFTPDIDKAADFIISEFKKAGLKPLKGANDFHQHFEMLRPKLISASAQLDGISVPDDDLVIISAREDVNINEKSGFETVTAGASDNFINVVLGAVNSGKNTVVFMDSSFEKSLPRIKRFARQILSSSMTVIFVVSNTTPTHYSITAKQSFERMPLNNIAGMLPGKSKPNEYVIFSAHYDHLGVGKPVNGDSIYNGANDDAAGTTAVIMLARYFKAMHNNQRTLLFVAFSAEEIGEIGSTYFSKQVNPDEVKAMFNIEMIGTESKWGKNSAYITGYDKTDMGKILQDNLKGSNFTFYPDPYTKENLFYRSDNASLARVGVPAHTISTSKMDNEPNYHKVTDEISTLDMGNMAEIIKAIAISSQTIVSGKDTPTRVAKEEK